MVMVVMVLFDETQEIKESEIWSSGRRRRRRRRWVRRGGSRRRVKKEGAV
jgi:hypothetical protein